VRGRLSGALITCVALALPAGAAGQGTGKPIVGGGSFNTAPLLESGAYSDTVVADERNFYRVQLAKGQQLAVDATVDATAIERDLFEPGYDEGLVNLTHRLDLWSPIREPLDDEIDEAGTELEGDDDVGLYTGQASTRRALGYRQLLLEDFTVDKFEGPGDYYVEIAALAGDIWDAPKTKVEFPVEFTVRVTGQAEESSADFSELVADPQPQGGGTSGGSEVVGGSEDGGESDPVLVIAIFAGFGLVSGLALGALAALLLRRSPQPSRP
jgi:hypothetical protein